MAMQKGISQLNRVAYTSTDAHGNAMTVQDSNVTGAIAIGAGHGSGTNLHLTQQNAIDLLPILQAFIATGKLS